MSNKEPKPEDYISDSVYHRERKLWKAKQLREHDRLTCDSPPFLDETDQHTPGAKLDQDKMDLSLLGLLPDALMEVCRVMDYGQTKYSRGGFLHVPNAPRRYTAAMLRHWLKEPTEKYDSGDPFYDTEAGLPYKGKIRHDAQVAVNALFRLQCTLMEEEAAEHLPIHQREIILPAVGDQHEKNVT